MAQLPAQCKEWGESRKTPEWISVFHSQVKLQNPLETTLATVEMVMP